MYESCSNKVIIKMLKRGMCVLRCFRTEDGGGGGGTRKPVELEGANLGFGVSIGPNNFKLLFKIL